MKVEVQIRSILQHTWAEIEHDTGYKSTVEVPKHIRRRFSRLAGLLELADQEFIGIRQALIAYSQDVAKKVETSSMTDEVDAFIDKVSLAKFMELDPLVQELDNEIASILRASKGTADLEHALGDIKRLKLLGIETLSQLKSALLSNKHLVISRAKDIASVTPRDQVEDMELRMAISILYLVQVLAVKNSAPEDLRSVLKSMGFSGGDKLAKSLAKIVDESERA